MPPWFVETVSLRARRRAGRVDDVKALGGARRVVADTDGVWIVSCLDQEQNVDAQISSDLENIVQLVVQRPDVETAKVHTPGSCDVALSTDSRQSSLTRCTSDRLTGDGERFNWRSAVCRGDRVGSDAGACGLWSCDCDDGMCLTSTSLKTIHVRCFLFPALQPR